MRIDGTSHFQERLADYILSSTLLYALSERAEAAAASAAAAANAAAAAPAAPASAPFATEARRGAATDELDDDVLDSLRGDVRAGGTY